MMALAKTTKTLRTRLGECLSEIFPSRQIPAKPLRIGVLILEEKRFGKHGADAVKYLVLQLNCRQKMFQFEFLPVPEEDPLVRYLNKKAPVSDKYLDTEGRILDDKIKEEQFGRFEGRNHLFFIKTSKSHKLEDKEPPHCYVFVTFCQLSSKAFGRSNENIGLLAFGDWKKHLAPPSILEFIVTILLRQATSFLVTELVPNRHLGTKGCLFDYAANLHDAKFKVLQGFVCHECRAVMKGAGQPHLADQLEALLSRKWVGKPSTPGSPAHILKNLGYDLFATKDFRPGFWERSRLKLQEEGVKEFVHLIGTVLGGIAGGVLTYFGIKISTGHP